LPPGDGRPPGWAGELALPAPWPAHPGRAPVRRSRAPSGRRDRGAPAHEQAQAGREARARVPWPALAELGDGVRQDPIEALAYE